MPDSARLRPRGGARAWPPAARRGIAPREDLKLPPGGSFRLETDLGSVTVTGKPSADVKLMVTSRRELYDLLAFRFEEGSGSVTVSARRKHRMSGWFSDSGKVHYEIEVPAETALAIDTSGGRIVVGASTRSAKLDTSGGGIEGRDLVGDLEATPPAARST